MTAMTFDPNSVLEVSKMIAAGRAIGADVSKLVARRRQLILLEGAADDLSDNWLEFTWAPSGGAPELEYVG